MLIPADSSIPFVEAQTRIVVPFSYSDDARANLANLRWKDNPVWVHPAATAAGFPTVYQETYLPGFTEYYIPPDSYFIVEPNLPGKWFGAALKINYSHGSADGPSVGFAAFRDTPLDFAARRQPFGIGLERPRSKPLPPIELILGRHGVGILAISLAPIGLPGTLTLTQLKQFNNKLAQTEIDKAAFLCGVNSEDEAASLEFPKGLRQTVYQAIKNEQAGSEGKAWRRFSSNVLGRVHNPNRPIQPSVPGEWFCLRELVDFLLTGIRAAPPETRQPENYHVFTVAQLPEQWTAATLHSPQSEPPRHDLIANAAALAQLEEDDHPLPPSGAPGIACEILDTHSVVAVSSLGAAQLYVNQPPDPNSGAAEHAFNQSLLNRGIEKRWPAFLAALVQRDSFLLWSKSLDSNRHRKLKVKRKLVASVRELMLHFLVSGYFSESSQRDVLNRFYALCQRGLRVSTYRELMQDALTSIEAADLSNLQTKTLRGLHQTQLAAHALQRKAEWFEFFLLTIYLAELTHIFTTLFEWREIPAAWCTVAMMTVGAVFYLLLAQTRSSSQSPPPVEAEPAAAVSEHHRLPWFSLGLVGLLFAAMILLLSWLGSGRFSRIGSEDTARRIQAVEEAEHELTSGPHARFAAHPRVQLYLNEAWRLVELAKGEQAHHPKTAARDLDEAAHDLQRAAALAEQAAAARASEEHFHALCPSPCKPLAALAKDWNPDRAWAEGDFDAVRSRFDQFTARLSSNSPKPRKP